MRNRAGTSAVLFVLAWLLVSCADSDESVRLTLGHGLDTNHPVHHAMVHMADVLDEVSGGTMHIDIYPNRQLGAERELVELLQIGSLDLTKVSASPLESFSPEMGVFSVPYVFRDGDHFWRVATSSIGRELLLSLESVDLRGLTYYDAGSRSFYTTDKPVHSPADLDGMKIRVQKSRTSVAMIEALGGAATPIDWGELYTALQQGVVDGAENNPPSFHLSRHYEAAKYFTLDEHTFVPDVLMVSTLTWRRLDGQQQEWLQRAANESAELQRRLWAAATEEALDTVRAAGVEVISPDKEPFRDSVSSMHASYAGTPIGALIDRIGELP
tara:strand:- start:899 stop:1879 length:981 start_codon:yes stop_codon:yes gene_type:complete